MSLGLLLIVIVVAGYLSNLINWKLLNYPLTHYLYYIGAFVHESSHAILCLLTGAKIVEFKVFSSEPHVTYLKPRLPLIGNMLISSAPIFGGTLFLYLINRFVLSGYFTPIIPSLYWQSILVAPLRLMGELHFFSWQSVLMLLLLLNVGAMIGPSFQDMKNMWFMLILLLLINVPVLSDFLLVVLTLTLANIVFQLCLALIIWLSGMLWRRRLHHVIS